MENSTTKEKVLAASIILFSRFGVQKTSMDMVAKEAKISKPTIYKYFGNKEQLFVEVCKSIGNRIMDFAKQSEAIQTDIVKKLITILSAKFTVMFELVESSVYARELLEPSIQEAQDLIKIHDQMYRRYLLNTIEQLIRENRISTVSYGADAQIMVQQLMQIGYGSMYQARNTEEFHDNLDSLVTSYIDRK